MRQRFSADSATWTGRDNNVEFLLDHPLPYIFSLDAQESGLGDTGGDHHADIFGQRAAIATLHDLCLSALGHRRNGERSPPQPITVALNGRYGQGKTTVLEAVRQQLLLPSNGFHRFRVGDFDVSSHKPDLLTYEFDKLIGNWTFGIRVLMFLLVMAVLYFVYVFFQDDIATLKETTPTTFLTFVAIPSLFVIFRRNLFSLFVGDERWLERFVALFRMSDWPRLAFVLEELILGRPDILFVDNLDRASVDQQRAFLRSLRSHRHRLPVVVIVAFDETPLVLADNAPESPQDLLAKAFTTVVRLYPMTPRDVLEIVTHLRNAIMREDGVDDASSWRFLRHAMVGADLARILLAHRRHSTRFCYQFLNIAATTAATLSIRHPADFSAMMRLLGLFEFLPWIRHDPQALADILAEDNAAKLLDYAAGLLGREALADDVGQAVLRYLTGTRHMQPYFADWQTFTGRFGLQGSSLADRYPDTDAGPSSSDVQEIWYPELPIVADATPEDPDPWIRWVEMDLAIATESHTGWRHKLYEEALSDAEDSPIIARFRGMEERDTAIQVRLAVRFLIFRLWFSDHRVERRLPAREEGMPLRLETLFLEESHGRLRVLPELERLQREAAVRTAFGQLLIAGSGINMSFFEALVATSSFVPHPGFTGAEPLSQMERHRLSVLEEKAEERISGPLPTLFGQPLDPAYRGIHVAQALPPLEVPLDPAGFDWLKVFRRASMLGRLERAGCSNVLRSALPFIELAVHRHGGDPNVLSHLVQVMCRAFPAFGTADDGVWRLETFRSFEPIVDAFFECSLLEKYPDSSLHVSDVNVPPVLLLMILHRAQDRSVETCPGILATFRSILSFWASPRIWPDSYLRRISEIAIAAGETGLSGKTVTSMALKDPQFISLLQDVLGQLENDPLNERLRGDLSMLWRSSSV